jgi:hypothetical protein
MEHVRAGVAVGYGVDIERVDLVDRSREARGRRFDDAEQPCSVALLC